VKRHTPTEWKRRRERGRPDSALCPEKRGGRKEAQLEKEDGYYVWKKEKEEKGKKKKASRFQARFWPQRSEKEKKRKKVGLGGEFRKIEKKSTTTRRSMTNIRSKKKKRGRKKGTSILTTCLSAEERKGQKGLQRKKGDHGIFPV